MAITRYTFIGTLESRGALHIGSGGGGRLAAGEQPTDATVIRDSHGRPYIPGSSLRGALRAAVCQLAYAVVPQPAQAILREDESEFQRLQRNLEEHVARHQREAASQEQSFDAEKLRQSWLAEELSPLERLFGTVLWASPLHIPDLHLQQAREVGSEVRHGVGIDRDTGAARESVKYDFEVLPAGTIFDFWMRCDLPDVPENYGTIAPRLLALGILLLEQGEIALGGRIARGVGQVFLRDLKVYRLALSDRSALLDALLAEEGVARYGTAEPPGWAGRMLQEAR
jgi:CRISPR-associated RAMP protein (TIGR02581 family)